MKVKVEIKYQETRYYRKVVELPDNSGLSELDYTVEELLADDRNFSPDYLVEAESKYTDWHIVPEVRPVDKIIRKEDCPVGTVITLGHPENRVLAVKGHEEVWRYAYSGGRVSYDDLHKSRWDVYSLPVGKGD